MVIGDRTLSDGLGGKRGFKSVLMAADSTMLRMVNLFIALSLGVHLEQLEHRIGLTWPLPFLLRPLRRRVSVFLLFSRILLNEAMGRKAVL